MTLRLKKLAVGLGTAFALMAGGMASAAPASAAAVSGRSAADLAPLVSCSNTPAPGGSFLQATFSQPDACRKCTLGGAAWEATGNYRAYCKNVRDGGSIVVVVQLWLFCVVCRHQEVPAL